MSNPAKLFKETYDLIIETNETEEDLNVNKSKKKKMKFRAYFDEP